MITLHRLGNDHDAFVLNCDLIVTVEATPDTHIHLATGARLVVAERPHEVINAIKEWRADIGRRALGTPRVEYEVRR